MQPSVAGSRAISEVRSSVPVTFDGPAREYAFQMLLFLKLRFSQRPSVGTWLAPNPAKMEALVRTAEFRELVAKMYYSGVLHAW